MAESKPIPRLTFRTEAELMALPPPEMLIGGILPAQGNCMLAAEQSCGKTTLLLDWGYRMTREQPWHGREVKGGNVLFLLGEGWVGMGQRIKAWYAANPKAMPTKHVAIFAELPSLSLADGMLAMVKHLSEQPYQMVVIDTMNMALPGVDENSAQDIAFYFRALNELRTKHKCTFVTTHHLNKNVAGIFGAHRIRGSTAIAGSLDTLLMMHQEGDCRVLTQQKQRDAELGPAIHLAIKPMTLPDGSRGPYIVPASQDEKAEVSSILTVRGLLAAMAMEGATIAQLVEESKLPRSTVNRLVRQIGCWSIAYGKAGSHRYWLPGQQPGEATPPPGYASQDGGE